MAIFSNPDTTTTIKTGKTGETCSFTETSVWVVDGDNDIKQLLDSYFLPKYDDHHPKYKEYRCNEVSVTNVFPRQDIQGGYIVEVDVLWETKKAEEEDRNGDKMTPDTPPWLYPVEDLSVGTQSVEKSMVKIWVPDKENGGFKLVPFENTAGSPLVGTYTHEQLVLSFTCNMPLEYPESFAIQYNGKVNADPVVVCGYSFAPLQLRVASLSVRIVQQQDKDGNDNSYKKIAIQLIGEPNTFLTEYANVGLFVATKNGRKQIWTANYASKDDTKKDDKETIDDVKAGEVVYGTRAGLVKQINAGKVDALSLQAVTEPMFISKNGKKLSAFEDDGRQEPIYLKGCPFDIVPFAPLGLPR